MKKIILSLLVAFCGISASAQNVSTTLYTKVGLNVNGMVGAGASDMDATKARAGYDLNFGFQRPMGSVGLYWGMEYGLTSRGYKTSKSFEDYSETTKEIRHDIIWSPFVFGFRKNLVGDLDIDAHTGLFMSCDYTGKDKTTIKASGHKESNSTTITNSGSCNRFDAGLKFGVGLWYKRYNLDLSYRQGFVHMFVGDKATDSSNFIVSLGIAF